MAKQESELLTDESSDTLEESAPDVTSAPTTGTRLTAREIYHNVRVAAEEEMKRPLPGLFWSALTCGLVIGFSFLAAAPIAAFGFRHSLAGSVGAFYLAWAGLAGLTQIWLGFIIPAVIGNVIGGVMLVALLNHGRIMAGRKAIEGEK